MAAGRKEDMRTFCWLLAVVLSLQATVSMAFPVLHTELRSEEKKGCITIHADTATIQPTPSQLARSLAQHLVQHDYVLTLPAKETIRTEEVEEGPEDAGALLDGGGYKLCPGEWSYKSLPPNLFVVARYPVSGASKTSYYLLLSSEALDEIAHRGNISLTVTCTTSLSYCFNIFYSDSKASHTLLRRSANRPYNSPDTPSSSHAHTPVLVAVVVAIVSLAVFVSLVALCAGSSAYDPKAAESGVVLQKSPSEAPSSEPTVQFNSPKSVNVEIETTSEPAANNGAVKEKTTDQQKTPSPQHRDSLDPTASPNREETERETRSRTLSARSFDPLPEIPKLETAEEAEGQRSTPPKEEPEAGDGRMDDEDDEAGYAYARVGGAPVGGMDEADSDKEDKDKDDKGQKSELPPYGKVSHHVTKPKVTETEEYAEVKEVFRGPLAHVERRGRSATEPIDPAEVGQDSLREKRALTHTHMMPLPDVPRPAIAADDNDMYDSIPEDMRTPASQVPQAQAQTPPTAAVVAATPPTKSRPKERLYESMDDMEEDTYESVPDNLKAESPLLLSSKTPPRSPSKSSTLPSSTSPPLPPTSPIPKPQPKEPEKKPVEKTLSASQAEGDGKRRFSFFSRKKTASVSAGAGKKKEKEKHAESKDHHASHQPLPNVPASSPVTSPPLPPIPANDDDDDTMYDTPQLDFMSGPPRGSPGPGPASPGALDAKAKSQSLPSSARSAGGAVFHGARANIPLPRVPEDSGQGIVIRERVLESPTKGTDEEKPYDSVKISGKEKPYDSVKVMDELEDINEPNYDTVDKEEIFKAVAEAEAMESEPGYDRVKQLEGQRNGVKVERGRVPTPPATEGDAPIVHDSRPRSLSPEDGTRGIVPEHDEEGYACVPEDFKMRKRALSASKGSQVKRGTPEPDKTIGEDTTTSPAEPVEPSETYATVDIIAKKQSQRRDTLDAEDERARQRSASPVPPPVPPVGDLGDVAAEFSRPPVPVQSDDVLELVPPDDSSLLKPAGSDDPPYAKVKSKDHPYAELDLGAAGEVGKLTVQDETTEAGYDKVRTDTGRLPEIKDAMLGYDTVTDHEVNVEVVDGKDVGHDEDQQVNEEPGYDTVVDSRESRGEARPSQLEQETPKLEPAEPQQQLYDSLEPLETEEKGGEGAGNLYDSLEPEQPRQMQNGVSPEDVEEQRYEEIDEDTRMELIAKQKQWSQGKFS